MNGIQSNNVNVSANALAGTNTDYKDNVKAKLASLEGTSQDNAIEQPVVKTEKVEKVTDVEAKEQLSTAQLETVAKQLQEFVGEMNRGLEFLVDEDSGRDVIKVIDKNSGDLVKQYPSEEVLSVVAKLSEATGNLFDSKI